MPYRDVCLNKVVVDNSRLSVDKQHPLWTTHPYTPFLDFQSPPYLGGGFESFQNMESESYPPCLWMVCGQVMPILSTGGRGLGPPRQSNIQSEAGFSIPDMAVRGFHPQLPQPLRLLLNPNSYLIKMLELKRQILYNPL